MLEQLAMERERRERAALRADAEFITEILNAARKVFQMIDDDGSGKIDMKEFRQAVSAMLLAQGFSVSAAEADALFKQLDADGSGLLEYAHRRPSH